MAIMRDIVTGAALRQRVADAVDDLDPNDAQRILRMLNDMMASWEGQGVNIAWTGDLELSGTFPLASKHEAGVKAMLAVRLSDDYAKTISQQLKDDANSGWAMIQADYILPDLCAVDYPLRNMPSQRRLV
jgi:hypothetical protein